MLRTVGFIKYIVIIIVVALSAASLTNYLSPRDKLAQADAIVAISGGDTASRAEQATKLYKEGWANEIIFSGAALDPSSPSNANVMKELARSTGIPEEVINIEEGAKNTAENASNSTEIIKKRGLSSIILVTAPYHQRRAYLEFREALGPDVTIINYPVEDGGHWAKTWWMTPAGWYTTASEAIKVAFTLAKNSL